MVRDLRVVVLLCSERCMEISLIFMQYLMSQEADFPGLVNTASLISSSSLVIGSHLKNVHLIVH